MTSDHDKSPTSSAEPLRFEASIDDMKLVYRVLHENLSRHIDLMDCDFLDALQRSLQKCATAEGVEIGDHGSWDAWLGNQNALPCEQRLSNRKVIE